MAPSHASGLCACTYHLFYNAPALNGLVLLQSFLTLFGNCTMAWAAYRVYAFAKEQGAGEGTGAPPLPESDGAFLRDMFVKSLVASLLVKYGELALDFPFDAAGNSALALALVGLPTLANLTKWRLRSAQSEGDAALKLPL